MTLAIVRPGTGLFRDVLLLYAVRDHELIREALWPEACVMADQAGPYALVGAGDIEPLGRAVPRARREVGPFSVRGVVLAGVGSGCRAVREQIREGARPDVVLAMDGMSGPPGQLALDEYYLGPWRVVADRARRGECLAVLTHTAQTYMEALPAGQEHAAPIEVLREVTGFALPALGPGDPPVQTREGGLVVLSFPSLAQDREAHAAQRTVTLPHVLAAFVRPWLREMDFTPTSLPRWHV